MANCERHPMQKLGHSPTGSYCPRCTEESIALRAAGIERRNNQFGDLSLTWREPMSRVEFDELKEFVAIWLRGIERRLIEPVSN